MTNGYAAFKLLKGRATDPRAFGQIGLAQLPFNTEPLDAGADNFRIYGKLV